MSKALIEAVFGCHLPPAEKHVLTIMAWFGSDDGTNIFPSIPTLCHHTGYKRSNVQKIIARLKKRGILVLQMRMGKRRGFVPVYKMDLSGLPPEPLDSVYPSTLYGRSDNVDSVHPGRESVHDSRKVCTPVRDSVYPSTQDQYLVVKEQEGIVASKFSISDSQNQTQEQPQRQNLTDKGKAKAGETISTKELLRDLPHVVGSKARKSPLHDDEAREARKAELKSQEAKALEIVAKMQESGARLS